MIAGTETGDLGPADGKALYPREREGQLEQAEAQAARIAVGFAEHLDPPLEAAQPERQPQGRRGLHDGSRTGTCLALAAS